jgi:hypothetical protein
VDDCLLFHLALFCISFAKNEATYNSAPYQSISRNFILFDNLFRKEYRYGLIIYPLSTGEKQQARPPADRTESTSHAKDAHSPEI